MEWNQWHTHAHTQRRDKGKTQTHNKAKREDIYIEREN